MYKKLLHTSDLKLDGAKDSRPSMDLISPDKIRSRHVLGPADRLFPGEREDALNRILKLVAKGVKPEQIAAMYKIPAHLITDYLEDRDV